MRRNKWIALIVIVVMLNNLCIYVYAQNITDLQNQSNELTEEINNTNNILRAVQDEISQNMIQLQEIDIQIEQSKAELEKIDVEVDELMKQIEENENKLSKIENEYNSLEDTYKKRLVAIYEAPKLQYLDVLLDSNNFIEFISNYYSVKELMEYDKELIEKAKKQKNDLETTKKKLSEKKNKIVTTKQTQQKKNQVLANTKTMREYYLSKLTEKELNLQQQIDTYNIQMAEIESEIRLLAYNSISEDYIGGAMKWPVPGYTKLTSTYGMRVHPITGTFKLHTGIDIGAPMGASFIASANGIVTKATYNSAYGNMVIIDHGAGVQTLYAHGSEIKVQLGQVVEAGTEVLKVGSTGYSTGPHAHFEIRINGQTVNPLDFLLDLEENNKDGESTTEQSPENNTQETEKNNN